MLRLCSRTLVKVGMVRPVSVSVVAVRQLTKQKGLPKMPVPALQQTCEVYLRYLEPLLEEDELRRTRELVEEFQRAGGVGERLQRGLERRAEQVENWITEDFVKTEFLKKRDSLVSLSNTGGVLPRRDYRDKKGQIRYAAEYLAALLEFKKMVDDDTLPVDKMKGRPLCMRQYEQLISSCRIPGSESDSLEFYARSANPPKHFAVIHNNQFFLLEAYHSDGTALSEDQLCVQLQRICDASPQTCEEPVGILTSQHREIWSRAYNNLMKDDTNRASLLAIQSSIFTVCLDGAMPPVSEETYRKTAILHMMHGGGSRWNSANRWFDKGMQVIIADNGISGAGLTHAAVDGVMAMILAEHTLALMKKPKVTGSQQPLPEPQKLHFNISPEIKKDIEEAKQHMDTLVQRLDWQISIAPHFGKSFMMAHKMSPDAFLQVAIQLAYYRTYQRICSTWEPATLRLFSQGRLGFIHSHSPAAAAFVKAIDDPQKQNSEKVDLLKKAVKTHVWNTNMAISGQDINNHLQGLKAQAVRENIPIPELFTDASFTKAFDYKLSTSQVWSSTGTLPCIGPEPGQHMVVYHILNDFIDLTVSALEVSSTSKELDAGAMIRALEDALLDMKNLLEQTSRAEQ